MKITNSLALLGSAHLATSQLVVPYCLQECLTETDTQLCGSTALSGLTACILRTCLNPPATQDLIANLGVSFSPKALYSCQQSYSPSTNSAGDSVTLPLNESCATSPYDFRSFVPQHLDGIGAENGCQIIVYGGEDCLGEAMSADIGVLGSKGEQCIFRGGRSARLVCANQLDAARAFIHKTCATSPSSGDDLPVSASPSLPPFTSIAVPSPPTIPFTSAAPSSISISIPGAYTPMPPLTGTPLPMPPAPFTPQTASASGSDSSSVSMPDSVMGTATWPSTWLANETWSTHTATDDGMSTADPAMLSSLSASMANATGTDVTHTITLPGYTPSASATMPYGMGGGMGNGTYTSMMPGSSPTGSYPAIATYTGAAAVLSAVKREVLGLAGVVVVALV